MTLGGTAAYDGLDDELPPPVRSAVALARRLDFGLSCLPQQGALLRLLAGGIGPAGIGAGGTDAGGTDAGGMGPDAIGADGIGAGGPPVDGGLIGESGTGAGVGLAWLLSGANPGVRLVSAERDRGLAFLAAQLFADHSNVDVIAADWHALAERAPYDLLVLDGGGAGKGTEDPLDPADWLRPGGLLVIDDFAPMTGWPPVHDGFPDTARLHWLNHPRMRASEIRVTPAAATIVATYVG